MSRNAKIREDFTGNSAAEEAPLGAAIDAGSGDRELTAKDFAKVMPFPVMPKRRGRPRAAKHKIAVTLRLDPEVVEHFRRDGRGWQTRINDALVGYVANQQRDAD